MMNRTTATRQRGLTFANFLLMAILLVLLAIFGMKVVPAFVENRTIAHILDKIAHDPDLQNSPPQEIRQSFEKNAMMNNITVVTGQDILVDKTPAGWVLEAKYNVKIGLVGNASLLLEFDTSSAHPR